MAGLHELSKEAGYSIRTVNRVLKGNGYVSFTARRAIEAAVSNLGYHPNLAARALKEERSHIISVLTFSSDELRMAQVATLQQELLKENYLVSLTFQLPFAESHRIVETLRNMIGQGPAGIVVLGAEPEITQRVIPALLPTLTSSGLPYVLLDPKGFFDSMKRFDSVTIDRGRGVREAVHYLAKRGAKRIAYLGTQEERTRLDGYEKAMKELGRRPLFLEYPGVAVEQLRQAGRDFARMKKRPDAVLAHSDFIAMAFLAGLHDAGVKVPDEVALVGFDNRLASSYSWPRLTTIAQPTGMVGEAGANILLRKIRGHRRPPGGWSLNFYTELIVRETA